VRVSLTVDPAAEDVSLEVSLAGKDGSPLAADIAGLADPTALGPPLSPVGAAGLNVALPEPVRKPFAEYVEAEFREAMRKQTNDLVKAIARKAFDAARPSLYAGRINAVAALDGPFADGKFSLLFGLRLAEEKKVEDFVKE